MSGKKKQGIENLFEEVMTGNLPDIAKKRAMQVQKVHRVLDKLKPKRPTPRHIIIKLANSNDKYKFQRQLERDRKLLTRKSEYQLISQESLYFEFQAKRNLSIKINK